MQAAEASPYAGELWITIRRDARSCEEEGRCAFLAHALNLHEHEWRIDRIDFTGVPGINDATVLEAPDGTIVLRGSMHGATFDATESFRGLPGFEPREDDVFVQIAPESPEHSLDRSSRPGLAAELNTGASARVSELSFSLVETPGLDRLWLRGSAYDGKAIVTGHFMGVVGGRGIVRFEVSQVFVPLERKTACPLRRHPWCRPGTVATFERDRERCLVPTACRPARGCREEHPECAPGYTLRSWRIERHGCFSFACDPAFLTD
jgi:hypothetical protein